MSQSQARTEKVSRKHLIIIAILVAIGLGGGAWMMMGGDGHGEHAEESDGHGHAGEEKAGASEEGSGKKGPNGGQRFAQGDLGLELLLRRGRLLLGLV